MHWGYKGGGREKLPALLPLHAGGLRNRPRTGSKSTLGSYDSREKGENDEDGDGEE